MFPEIPQYFNGKVILLTGATGFLGKALLEKLLRSCSGLKKIYLLMRSKKGLDSQKRLELLFESELFSLLRKQRPDFKNCVQCVNGDITSAKLGLSDADYELLKCEVDIVVHLAATIKFNEPLRNAVLLNLHSVKEVINLCLDCHHLDVLVHVSTAYANCDRREIDEKVYQTSVDPRWIMEAVESMNEESLSAMTPALLKDRPNTYTFTKALAECLVEEAVSKKGLRAAIFRPSMVSCIWEDPLPGWLDNFSGPAGVNSYVGRGLLRTMLGDKKAVIDLIPVDTCANMIIAIAWKTGCIDAKASPTLNVYHCTSGELNPVTLGFVDKLIADNYTNRVPLENVVFPPCQIFTTNVYLHLLIKFVEQEIPAYLMDMYLKFKGEKPKYQKTQERINLITSITEYFSLHDWKFASQNAIKLRDMMSDRDKQRFNIDISKLNWESYILYYCTGVKKYPLKEDMSRTAICLENVQRIKKVQNIFTSIIPFAIILIALFMWIFLTKTSPLSGRSTLYSTILSGKTLEGVAAKSLQ